MDDKLIEDFNKRNNVTYELRAFNGDGEMLAHEISALDFDDVSNFATLLDDEIRKLAIADLEHKEADFSEASDEV